MTSAQRAINSGGFTLLEVMTALAIMAVSLTVLSQSQTNSARAIGRARQVTIATMLARHKMVEVEDELFKEGFSDFEEEDKDDFGDLEFKAFSYVVKVEKVELPTNIDAQSITDAVSGGGEEGGGGDAPGGGMFAMGAKMMSAQFEMFRNVLEQSIRRVTVRVSWMEGKRERYVTVTTYFTDPRKIDNVAGGAGGLDSLVNQLTGGGTSGPGGTATGGSGGTPTGGGGTATGRGGVSLPGGGARPIMPRVPRR